jgi:hypothetical protein
MTGLKNVQLEDKKTNTQKDLKTKAESQFSYENTLRS